ncbi:hypothetical protein [Cypionkella psychrotolerans]|uniref:hypothetical protein n=1 Tax=Cypionkella psychrotolerans TaxID=1678131 RepID=UPI000ABA1A01|nr:hypothetical protein [Cypionkella psychrotolerans]
MEQLKTCTSLSNLKACALFFDRVLPFNPIEFIDYNVYPEDGGYQSYYESENAPSKFVNDIDLCLTRGYEANRETFADLLFGKSKGDITSAGIDDAIDEIVMATHDIQEANRGGEAQGAFYNAQYILQKYHITQQALAFIDFNENKRLKSFNGGALDRLNQLQKRFGFDNSSIYMPKFDMPERKFHNTSIELSIIDAPVLDLSKTSWEQIIDIRRDDMARKRLRRLSVEAPEFLRPHKDGFEDRLLLAIDEYQSEAKKHGIDTAKGMISIAADWKVLASFLPSVALSIPKIEEALGSDQSIVPAAVGVVGGLFAVANFAVKAYEVYYLSKEFSRKHPLAFLGHDLSKELRE